jgi:hypothetical protein
VRKRPAAGFVHTTRTGILDAQKIEPAVAERGELRQPSPSWRGAHAVIVTGRSARVRDPCGTAAEDPSPRPAWLPLPEYAFAA